ncbi:hypothetical protein BASA62_000391, partial [Batrachochytrium salamandrivorans]
KFRLRFLQQCPAGPLAPSYRLVVRWHNQRRTTEFSFQIPSLDDVCKRADCLVGLSGVLKYLGLTTVF